jgi:hypothetical protein
MLLTTLILALTRYASEYVIIVLDFIQLITAFCILYLVNTHVKKHYQKMNDKDIRAGPSSEERVKDKKCS